MPFGSSPNKLPVVGSHGLLIVFLLISVLVLSIYSNEGENGPFHSIQNAVGAIVVPVKLVGSGLGAVEQGVGSNIENITASGNTLSALQEQNEQLRQLVSNLEEHRQEAQRLRDLLGLSDQYDLDAVACRVVGQSDDAWNRVITIDKGSTSGIEPGMTVLGTAGVIGQIQSVTPLTATVRLLQDAKSGAAAIIQSSRASGVVRGSLEGLLYLEDVENDVSVEVGDVVVTSGAGGGYDRGLLIGTVVRIDQTQGQASRRIIVSPNTEAMPLQEVLVVIGIGSEGLLEGEDDSSADASDEDGDLYTDGAYAGGSGDGSYSALSSASRSVG